MIRLWISLERADPLDLGSAVEQVSNAGASGLHVDFCDAHFVPSLNGSVRQVAAITARSSLPVDVHLMAEQPEFLIGPLKEAGAHSVTFHAETTRYPTRIARMIRCAGMRAILAINPSTPAPVLDFSTPWIDGVSLLTSEPDGGSEGFLPAAVTARKAFLADLPLTLGYAPTAESHSSTASSSSAPGSPMWSWAGRSSLHRTQWLWCGPGADTSHLQTRPTRAEAHPARDNQAVALKSRTAPMSSRTRPSSTLLANSPSFLNAVPTTARRRQPVARRHWTLRPLC